jgi:hypothetical protein
MKIAVYNESIPLLSLSYENYNDYILGEEDEIRNILNYVCMGDIKNACSDNKKYLDRYHHLYSKYKDKE